MTYRSDYIDKEKVFRLLRQGLGCKVIALRTGYSVARVSQLKKEKDHQAVRVTNLNP